MPKPSEIFDTPEAISRVGGNEEVRTITCRTCGGDGYTVEPSMPDGEPEQVQCNDCHAEGEYTTLDEVRRVLTTKDQEKEEAVKKERSRILKEINDSRDHDSCECDNCHRWRKYYKKALPTEDNK